MEIYFVLISFPVFLFQFLFCYILERKDKKWFKRDIIVLISFLIVFVSISFLVNIGKEMSLPGFRKYASGVARYRDQGFRPFVRSSIRASRIMWRLIWVCTVCL